MKQKCINYIIQIRIYADDIRPQFSLETFIFTSII